MADRPASHVHPVWEMAAAGAVTPCGHDEHDDAHLSAADHVAVAEGELRDWHADRYHGRGHLERAAASLQAAVRLLGGGQDG